MTFEITLKQFRAFDDPGPVTIRPITLLTGANSSGKSSFLAAVRFMSDISYASIGRPSFNKDPFYLGSFDQIAHHRGGRYGRAGSFSLGFSGLVEDDYPITGRGEQFSADFTIEFENLLGQPIVSNVSYNARGNYLVFS